MALATTWCLLLFVVACLSLKIDGTGTMKYMQTYNFTINATNLKDSATLIITHSVPVVVCIQEKFHTPAGNQFSNDTCTFFNNFTTGPTSTERYGLRNLNYYVGIYFADNLVKPDASSNVSISINGDECQRADLYYDSLQNLCTKATNLTDGPFWVNFTKAQLPRTLFFSFEAKDMLNSIEVKPVELTSFNVSNLRVRMRYEGVPSEDNNDAENNFVNNARFYSPRPGIWVIAIEGKEGDAGDYQFNLYPLSCDPMMTGPDCKHPIYEAKENMTELVLLDEYLYYRFRSTTNTVNVSVTTKDYKNIPSLYLSKGSVPTSKENADVTNCNQGFCNVVHSISVPTEVGVYWYIAVTSIMEPNTTFGIWYNSTCPTLCENDGHGDCKEDGTCYCQLDYTGIDCTTSTGLGAQYIVLIIIAALVVASAIIGFVAWLYMRSRKVNYELVS